MFAAKPRVNLVLDTLILMVCVVTLVSGLLLEYAYTSGNGGSGGGGRALRGGRGTETAEVTTSTTEIAGITRGTMDDLHLVGGLLAGALVAVHLVFHLKWIACQVRRLAPPAGRETRVRPGPQPHAVPHARPGVQ